jgi:hypothetical protein
MARNWNGITLQEKIDRAAGRAIVGIGVAVATETKRVTHRITGTLVRSVHAATAGYEGAADDEAQAPTQDLMLVHGPPMPLETPIGPAVEVGSWLPYACVEWVGRMHPGVTQGLEMVRGVRADSIVRQAFLEEGL